MLITLMGKSGSGKSTIGLLFKEIDKDIQVIDVDKIVHDIYFDEDVKSKVVDYFGETILDDEGKVSRKKLANIVFKDKEKMKILCDITYSYIENQIDTYISKHEIVLLDYALLPKTKYFLTSDIKILVIASKELRGERVKIRDNISFEDFILRDNNSLEYSKEDFDYVINNNGNIYDLRKAVLEVYEKGIISGKF